MKIRAISQAPESLPVENMICYADLDALEAELATLDVVYLDLPAQQQDALLTQIRQHEQYFCIPVFVKQASPLSSAFADGLWPESFPQWQQQYHERFAQLLPRPTQHDEQSKLLTYLWLHPNRRLEPQRQTQNGRYFYPLLALWLDVSDTHDSSLANLNRSGLISPDQLLNRVKYCQQCGGGALNFVETCPACGSFDTTTASALHCFTCGHIDAESEFLRPDGLSCPNCYTRLRHIGVDYDRPIENQQCNSCNTRFIDSDVKAHCFNCGHSNQLHELVENKIYNYKLHDQGIIWIKTGQQVSVMPSNIGEPVANDHFAWLCQWQNQLAQRHELNHVILALRFNNLDKLYQSYSSQQVSEKLDEFFTRFNNLVRQTDVVCRWQSDVLFYFLAHTGKEQVDVISAKLNQLMQQQQENPLEIDVNFETLPNPELNERGTPWFNLQVERLAHD